MRFAVWLFDDDVVNVDISSPLLNVRLLMCFCVCVGCRKYMWYVNKWSHTNTQHKTSQTIFVSVSAIWQQILQITNSKIIIVHPYGRPRGAVQTKKKHQKKTHQQQQKTHTVSNKAPWQSKWFMFQWRKIATLKALKNNNFPHSSRAGGL